MGFKLADAFVLIDGDSRPLRREQGRARASTKTWVQQLGGMIKTGLKTAALSAGALVTGALVGAGQAVMDAMPVQGIGKSFFALADGAKLAEMRIGSLNTVTDAKLMKNYNSAALLVNKTFADDLPEAMEYFGKISAATGEDIGLLMDSYVTGIGRLSPMILDNLKIQVNQTEANEAYAEQLGITVEEMTKEEQQAALNAQVMDLLAEKTAAMPDISENAATRLAQLRTVAGNLWQALGGALIPAVTQLLTPLSSLAMEHGPAVADVLGRMGEILSNVVAEVVRFVERIAGGQAPLTSFKILLMQLLPPDLFLEILSIVESVELFLAQVREFLAPIIAWIQENIRLRDVLIVMAAILLNTIVPAVAAFMGTVLSIAAPLLAAIGVVALLRQAWENDFLGMRTAVMTAWAKIQEVFQTISAWVIDTLIPRAQELYAAWSEKWQEIQTAVENAKTVLVTVFEELGRWINDNLGPWAELLRSIWVDTVWPEIQAALETAWGVVQPIFESIGEWARDKIPGAIEGLQGTWEGVMTALETAVSPVKDVWDGLVSAVQGFWDWISNKVFSFEFELPDLPDWAVPGSPIPLHTAWKNFARDMGRMEIAPRISTSAMAALGGRGDTIQPIYDQRRSYEFNLQGNYREQDEVSMADDVRLLAMQFGVA